MQPPVKKRGVPSQSKDWIVAITTHARLVLYFSGAITVQIRSLVSEKIAEILPFLDDVVPPLGTTYPMG